MWSTYSMHCVLLELTSCRRSRSIAPRFDPLPTQVAKPVTKSVRARRSVSVRAEEGAGSSAPAKVQRPATAPLFFTGVSEQSLSYLDGSLPGDFGFDPLVCMMGF